jgi:protein-S-isoprenylcysteine O-methyltransferase Ste14
MDLARAARDPWVWGQFALFLLVGLWAPLVPRFVSLGAVDPAINRIDPDWIRWLGAPVLLGGLALAIWGIRSLGPSLTPGTEPLPKATLVTTGAYAHLRHPIYAGLVLALAGYTLAWSNWMLALVVALIARAFFTRKARVEERWLAARHPTYQAYIRQVPRGVL